MVPISKNSLEEAHKGFPGMFLKDRNFLSWAMWLEQLRYPAPITLLKIGNFQSGFLIAKISSWHWTPFSFPSWFGLFSYSKKPKASQPARQPTSKSVHSKTSTWYIGNSHQDEKFPPLWASSWVSFSFEVGRIPFSHYWSSGVIRNGSPVWKGKSCKNMGTKVA